MILFVEDSRITAGGVSIKRFIIIAKDRSWKVYQLV